MLLGFLLLAGLLSAQQRNESRTGSLSSPFVVHGGTFALRAAVIQEGDAMNASLNKLTGEVKAEGKNAIVIELLPAVRGKSSRIRPEFYAIPKEQGGGYRLQVNVRLARGGGYVRKDLHRMMLEMLIIERSLRGREQVAEVEVKPWLVAGLEEAILWQENRGDRRVYISLAKSGGWLEVSKLVERSEIQSIDALGYELFRASAGALIMALLDQAEGNQAMGRYLAEAAIYEGEPLALIRRHFPEVNLGRKGLEKWWSLAIVKMAEKPLSDSMTIPETDKRLNQILRLHLYDDQGRPVPQPLDLWEQLATLSKEDRLNAVRPTVDLLTSLSYRSFPTYREVIVGYLKVLGDMVNGLPDEIEESLVNLKAFRDGELSRYQKVIDLLDWYHLSTVKEESGEFEDYLKIIDKLKEQKIHKNDHVTRYVDQIQGVFERSQK